MKLVLTTHNVSHSNGIEEHIRQRLSKLEALCPRAVEARVYLELDHARNQMNRFKCAIRIGIPGPDLYAEEVHDTLYGAIDMSFRKVEEQAKRWREKSTTGRQSASARAKRQAQDEQLR